MGDTEDAIAYQNVSGEFSVYSQSLLNKGILVISFLPEYDSNILTPCVQEIDDLMASGVGVTQPDEDELLAELGELLGDEVTINLCHESDQTLFFLYKCFSYKARLQQILHVIF